MAPSGGGRLTRKHLDNYPLVRNALQLHLQVLEALLGSAVLLALKLPGRRHDLGSIDHLLPVECGHFLVARVNLSAQLTHIVVALYQVPRPVLEVHQLREVNSSHS